MSSKSKALTNKPTVTTVCSSCHRLIVDEVYIRCIKCRDFQQCLQCFSRGLQCEQHIRTHPFVLISKEKKEIYEKGWTIDNEICLLTTLQQHGIDNWDAASYFISTKTPKECKDHYERVYLNHENAPNPKDVSNENPSNYQEKELYLLDGSLSNPSLAATNGTKQKKRKR